MFLTYTSEEDAIRDAQIFSEKTGVDVVVAEGATRRMSSCCSTLPRGSTPTT